MRATQAQPRTISCSSAPLWRCHALPASSATGRPRTFQVRGNRPCRSRHWEWLEGGAVAAAKTGYLAQQVGVAKRRELRLTQAWKAARNFRLSLGRLSLCHDDENLVQRTGSVRLRTQSQGGQDGRARLSSCKVNWQWRGIPGGFGAGQGVYGEYFWTDGEVNSAQTACKVDETRALEKRLYYERSCRDNATVGWLYKHSSGDSETASNQPVGVVWGCGW